MSLEKLCMTNGMILLKKMISELTNKQDYKTLNTLFGRKSNASKFYTRTPNEDIPQESKHFKKSHGNLCKVARSVPYKPKQEAPHNEFSLDTIKLVKLILPSIANQSL